MDLIHIPLIDPLKNIVRVSTTIYTYRIYAVLATAVYKIFNKWNLKHTFCFGAIALAHKYLRKLKSLDKSNFLGLCVQKSKKKTYNNCHLGAD